MSAHKNKKHVFEVMLLQQTFTYDFNLSIFQPSRIQFKFCLTTVPKSPKNQIRNINAKQHKNRVTSLFLFCNHAATQGKGGPEPLLSNSLSYAFVSFLLPVATLLPFDFCICLSLCFDPTPNIKQESIFSLLNHDGRLYTVGAGASVTQEMQEERDAGVRWIMQEENQRRNAWVRATKKRKKEKGRRFFFYFFIFF